MKGSKLFSAIIAVAMLVLSVSGLALAGGTETMETVRVWTNDKSYEPIVRPVVDEFNATVGLEKGVFIDYKIFGSDYHDVLNVALAADQGPEVYKFVGTVKEPYIASGWMLPINDMPGGEEFLVPWNPTLLNGYNVFGGKAYSLPVKVLTTKLMCNMDLLAASGFTAPPATWAEMAEMAKKVTEDNGGDAYGYGVHLKDTASSGKWYFATQFATSVGHMGYNFQTGRFAFSEFAPNMQSILQMKADDAIFPGGEGLDGETLMAQFSAGRIAMVNGVCWDVNNVDKFWAELGTNFKLGVFDTPVVDTNNAYKNYAQISDLLCFGPAAAKMPAKAIEAFKLFHSDAVLLDIQNNEVDFIARVDIQAQAPAEFSKAGTAEFGDTRNSYFTMTPPDGGITIEGQPYQNTLIDLAAGPVDADVAAVLTDLENRYNAALDKAIAEDFDMTLYIDENWNTKAE